MNQAHNIRLPGPVYSQLKALAATRSTTMVEVIASFLRLAVEGKEITPETSGVSARLFLDLDAPEGSEGPFVIITTPVGDMPPMDRDDALAVAAFLVSDNRGADTIRQTCASRTGMWSVERRGTSAKLIGRTHEGAEPVVFTMAPIVARGLSEQVMKMARSAAPDMN